MDNGGWVGGHWVGLLWLAYAHTGDKSFEVAAREWAARLVPRQNDTTTHDLGFLFELSHILGAKLTGDAVLKPPALQAARTLTRRFNSKGNFFQAWGPLDGTPGERGRIIIDTMMNLICSFGRATRRASGGSPTWPLPMRAPRLRDRFARMDPPHMSLIRP